MNDLMTEEEVRKEMEERIESESFEGSCGVRNLQQVLGELGYDRNGPFIGGDPILNFLADNPGACERIREFILEHFDDYMDNVEYELWYNSGGKIIPSL